LQLDLAALPYPSMRQPVFAPRGMVVTSQPLAAQAGLTMLQQGGNAVDAALATAIALTVVEPTSTGLGGDAFALVWDGATLHGLNGSGRSAAALTPEGVLAQGYDEVMPGRGWLPVTVPGVPAAWGDLHAHFGRLPFATLFGPAIAYAAQGYPVSPILARDWHWAHAKLSDETGPEFAGWAPMFASAGQPPAVGECWRSPDLAATLRRLAEHGVADFYHGATAQAIAAFAAQTGGLLTAADLAGHSSAWVQPIHTTYRGVDVWEIPPNGQGLTVLLALNILEGFDLGAVPRESVESYHWQVEALKLAFADAQRYIADPAQVAVPTDGLLRKAYAAQRRALIGAQALDPAPGEPLRGGTAYLAAADADGMMVSFIESIYSSFGSGIVVPGTGVNLQNRGAGFSLQPGHPNQVGPGKRPLHTIIPGFLTQDGAALGAFGLIGGHAQPQGHVQIVVNTLDYHLNPQASLDAPRWFWWEGREIKLEPTANPAIAAGLEARGHLVEIDHEIDVFGCGQILWRLPGGGYVAGSDGRTDGGAVGY
jgi:gamma-glutamyltranspeptidase/glutathione hydrolase